MAPVLALLLLDAPQFSFFLDGPPMVAVMVRAAALAAVPATSADADAAIAATNI